MQRTQLLVIAAAIMTVTGCDKAASGSASASAPSENSAPATSANRAVASVDLCSLVTKAEAESVLGKSLAPPQKQPGGDCWYLREGGTDFGDVEFILSIIYPPTRIESAREFEAFVAEQAKGMNENVKNSGIAAEPFKLEPAPGVGAPAYFIDPGLYVLKGGRILAVALGGTKGVEVAKLAVSRMP